jgi:hypothetical protein
MYIFEVLCGNLYPEFSLNLETRMKAHKGVSLGQGGLGIAKEEWVILNGSVWRISKYVIRGISIFGRCATIHGLIKLDNLPV